MLAIPGFENRSCPTNTFGVMMYRWTVPAEVATKSKIRFRLSTNDSEMLHFSDVVTVRANGRTSHAIQPFACHATTFLAGSLVFLGILLVFRWACGDIFSRRRLVRCELDDGDEKNLLPQIHGD